MATLLAFVTSYIRVHEFGDLGPDGKPMTSSYSIKVTFPPVVHIDAASLVDADARTFIESRTFIDLAQRAYRANKC